jgi:pullulanase
LKLRTSIAVSGILLCISAYLLAPQNVAATPLAAPQSIRDCDQPSHAVTLSPSMLRLDARAIWLNENLIQWPGTQTDARLQLVSSLDGSLKVEIGKPLASGVTIIPLTTVTTPIDAKLRERFKWLKDGAVVKHTLDTAMTKVLLTRQVVIVELDANKNVRAATGLQIPGALDALYAPAEKAELGANGTRRVSLRVR